MCRPEFDSKVQPYKRKSFKRGRKRILIKYTKKATGNANPRSSTIRMGRYKSNTIGYGYSRRIFAHELTHLFRYGHGKKMFRIELYLANNAKLANYKVYNLHTLFLK